VNPTLQAPIDTYTARTGESLFDRIKQIQNSMATPDVKPIANQRRLPPHHPPPVLEAFDYLTGQSHPIANVWPRLHDGLSHEGSLRALEASLSPSF